MSTRIIRETWDGGEATVTLGGRSRVPGAYDRTGLVVLDVSERAAANARLALTPDEADQVAAALTAIAAEARAGQEEPK